MRKLTKREWILIIIAIISLGVLTFTLIQTDDTKANPEMVSDNILEDVIIDNISFTNAELNYENKLSTYTVNVTNMNKNDYKLLNVSLTFTDDKDKVIATLIGYVGETLQPGVKKTVTASVDMDITNASKLKFIINK